MVASVAESSPLAFRTVIQDDGRVYPSARALAARDAWIARNPDYARHMTDPLIARLDDLDDDVFSDDPADLGP